MKKTSNRDHFSNTTKTALAKRAGFTCSICKAGTVGLSNESPYSVSCIGVAAHITAAAPSGARYDASMDKSERVSITNAIWLCSNHAALIDRDSSTWTIEKLQQIKKEHEEFVKQNIGIPQRGDISTLQVSSAITPREYAFIGVKDLMDEYREFIDPILQYNKLDNDTELGVLLCGSDIDKAASSSFKAPWTIFVNANWLRWHLDAQNAGYKTVEDVDTKQVYGQIPGWPDSFFEFLTAIVKSNMTFKWQVDDAGILKLTQ